MLSAASAASGDRRDRAVAGTQFDRELEFLLSLSSIDYLQCACCGRRRSAALGSTRRFPARAGLVGQGYFGDARFVDFLAYLTHWRRPEMAQYI